MIKDIIKNNETITPASNTLDVLHTHFPQCFNNEGVFDLEKFQTLIKSDIDITHEGYDLNFLGKNYARLLASIDTTTVIQPDLEHNSKPENADSQNLYISGDNLDGLKHLLKSYAGAVKCIYIDPPYNTGSDGFVYNDKFNYTAEELIAKLSISDEQAQKILDLTRRGSASHSAWLTFMYPRLLLARDLLTPDGVIFISIDDNEQANLRLLCDMIFGEENLVAMFCKKGTGGRQDSTYFAKVHEYIVAYSKPEFKSGTEAYEKNDNYPFSDSLKNRKYKTQLLRKWGDASRRVDRPNMYFPIYFDGTNRYSLSLKDIENPIVVYPMLNSTDEGRWRWGMKSMKDAILHDMIEIKQNNQSEYIAYEKIYEPNDEEENTKLYSTWLDNINNNTGKKLLKDLFEGNAPFDYPKPVDLIYKLLLMGNVDDSIILDFFSGSATTAHAVMQLNSEDGGKRKYISIQLPEVLDPQNVSQKTAYEFLRSVNLPTTLDFIGMERIRRAAAKIKTETDADIDYGFKHYNLVEPANDTLDKLVEFKDDALFTNNDTLSLFGKESVLETWLVKDGYGLGAKTQEIKLADYKAYLCGKHLYFIESGLSENDMVALLDKYQQEPSFCPEHIVVFGYSFNFTQTEMLRKNLYILRDMYKNIKANFDIRY